MANTALQRITQAVLTNKSGGAVAQGDVVVIDLTTASSFTTTTTVGFVNGMIGVVLEVNGIANNAAGLVAWGGPVPKVNLSGSASLGDLFHTHSVAKQAVRHAAGIVAGDFGIVLGTGTTPPALLWGLPAGATGAGSGNVTGPGSSTANHIATYADTTGQLLLDGGAAPAGFVADFQQTDYHGGNIALGTTTDSGFVDVDATNAKISFTPASAGKYKVTFTFAHDRKAASLDVFFRLTDGTTNIPSVDNYTGLATDEIVTTTTLSFVFTWTAVAQTIKLQKWIAAASTVTTDIIVCNNSQSSALLMLVERIGG